MKKQEYGNTNLTDEDLKTLSKKVGGLDEDNTTSASGNNDDSDDDS